jgi:quercetin 2,3-dioxygenase
MTNETPRAIRKVWMSVPTLEGAGVRLKRVFGFKEVPQLDPFLLLDHFQSDKPEDYIKGFPWHPHRGIETITYVLDGDVEHADSMGNKGIISSGDVQWMTAGSGIVHHEMPKGDKKGNMWGFQLWSNLPRSNKMMDPRYRDVKSSTIPKVKTPDGATVRIVSGKVGDVEGPVREIVTDPEYLDISLPAHGVFTHPVKETHNVFAFVVEGEGYFDPMDRDQKKRVIREGEIALYGRGNTVIVTAGARPLRFLLISGKPLNEPVAWYGPIVMNTQDELQTAFTEFQEGTFVKHAIR